MALQGSLNTLSVADVLWMLAATNKTGHLRIRSDRGVAAVWMRDGRVTAGTTPRVPDGPFDEVVSDLLRYEHGSFVFDPDDRAPQGEAFGSVDDLLRRAHGLLIEWEDLRASVPSLDHRVRLAEDLHHGEVTVTARQWQALAVIAEGCSVDELAARLGLTELGALRTLDQLRALGLTRYHAPRSLAPTQASTRTRPA